MIYWITKARPLGIAIVARPLGNDWLQDEVKALAAEGVQILVSLLTASEASELGLDEEERYCSESDVEFLNIPIEDRSVPVRGEISQLLERLANQAKQCRGRFPLQGGNRTLVDAVCAGSREVRMDSRCRIRCDCRVARLRGAGHR
jgi:hypothetical protein